MICPILHTPSSAIICYFQFKNNFKDKCQSLYCIGLVSIKKLLWPLRLHSNWLQHICFYISESIKGSDLGCIFRVRIVGLLKGCFLQQQIQCVPGRNLSSVSISVHNCKFSFLTIKERHPRQGVSNGLFMLMLSPLLLATIYIKENLRHNG